MRDPGVSCQLELFAAADPDPSPPAAKPGQPPSTGRLSLPVIQERVSGDRGRDFPIVSSKPTGRGGTLTEDGLAARSALLLAGLGLECLAPRVTVRWNARMRTAAGRAFYESYRIELNPGLLALPGVDGAAEVERTLRHELAHLVAHHRAGGRRIEPHGPEWQRACAELGIAGETRCHTLPFQSRRPTKKLIYECPACGSEIHRVRRFRVAVACYNCCRRQNGGRYDDRFRLKIRRAPSS